MAMTKRELIQFLDELVEVTSEENKQKQSWWQVNLSVQNTSKPDNFIICLKKDSKPEIMKQEKKNICFE